ncbi:efflux RND transporter periplasmic adaptor subunit [Thiohalobacter thiocyanaticus]|nr:HlyD family efflux transporter periplasmic adaptor subunit [Thiohalobacter thiocyanaticus]
METTLINLANRARRILPALAGLLMLLPATAPVAHNGIDHGDDAAAAEIHRISEPRFAERTERTEVVGILSGSRLELFIDAPGSNRPLDFDQVTVEADGNSFSATRIDAGHYRIPANWIRPGTEHSLLLTLTSPDRHDLVATSITTAGTPDMGQAAWQPEDVAIWASIGLLAVFTLWLIRLGLPGHRYSHLTFDVVVATAVIAVVAVASGMVPLHTNAEATTSSTDTGHEDPRLEFRIRRLPDGSLYVPKPAQRKLGIQTRLPQTAQGHNSISLVGKVQASPSGSADIVAALNGSLVPPEGGFPRPGQKVEKDQLLATLKPTLDPEQRADKESELAYLERDIYLIRKQIDRIKSQKVVRQDNSVQLDIREAELKGFLGRKRALERMFHAEIEIRSPIAGVVTEVGITAGENVKQGDSLFQVIDPESLWVEVISYDDGVIGTLSKAAIQSPGSRRALEFIGQGSQLRALGTPLYFDIENPAGLNAGELVNVDIWYGAEIAGIRIGEEAVSVDPRGSRVVWAHVEPERFAPRSVAEISPVAPGTAFIAGDFDPSVPLVDTGAALLNAAP